ncbi:class I SAM-dependent methyltransferase [Moorena producens]|uniref:class I SAM-dependent methyltransferase n=1 Tax=Moorena producens TaxID=1155739 RepID=UPI003C751292
MKLLKKIILDTFYSHKLKHIQQNYLLVNFGCGKIFRKNWINIDANYNPNTYSYDLREKLLFQDGQVKHIHCEHFLEHLEFDYAQSFLKECYRILDEMGTIRIIVPDAGKYLTAYNENNQEFFTKLVSLGGTKKPMKTKIEIINQMFRMGGDHKFAWDYETLELYLKQVGFKRVEKSVYGDMEKVYNIDGDDWWRIHESLYVNAYKT